MENVKTNGAFVIVEGIKVEITVKIKTNPDGTKHAKLVIKAGPGEKGLFLDAVESINDG